MKAYNAHGRAGCVSLRKARQTRTEVGIYHAAQAGLDPDGGPWVTVCETHGSLVSHESLAHARSHAPDPCGWCEDCSNGHS